MDIGAISILQVAGLPRVVRCELAAEGTHFRAADNTDLLTEAMRETLENLNISPEQDGLYPCSKDVIEEAVFPAIGLPSDLISFSDAGRLLYPDVADKTSWARVSALVSNNKLRVYRVGKNPTARYVSQTDVAVLRERDATAA